VLRFELVHRSGYCSHGFELTRDIRGKLTELALGSDGHRAPRFSAFDAFTTALHQMPESLTALVLRVHKSTWTSPTASGSSGRSRATGS
jgi:hypothetical protein